MSIFKKFFFSFVPPDATSCESQFKFSMLSPSVVFSMLSKLDVKKSVGPDGFSARFLKDVAAEITDPLTKLFNKSLENGVFPIVTGNVVTLPRSIRVVQTTTLEIFVLSQWFQLLPSCWKKM